jgi:hypothetical protein
MAKLRIAVPLDPGIRLGRPLQRSSDESRHACTRLRMRTSRRSGRRVKTRRLRTIGGLSGNWPPGDPCGAMSGRFCRHLGEVVLRGGKGRQGLGRLTTVLKSGKICRPAILRRAGKKSHLISTLFTQLLGFEARSHERGRRLRERLLRQSGKETGGTRDEESRLKAGCSQDWLPHKEGRLANPPHKVLRNQRPSRGFRESPALSDRIVTIP